MTNPGRFSNLNYRYLIAVLLFALVVIGGILFVSYASVQEADLFIPIDTEKIPEGLIVTNIPFKGIEVRVRGSKSTIRSLSDLKIRYTLDLSKVDVGVNTIPIHEARFPFPKGVSILKINHDDITVKVEKEIKKNLPVHISLTGKPAKGFEVVGTESEPASVMLRGSVDTLGPMKKVSTKLLDVTGRSGSFKKKVALNLKESLKLVDSSEVVLAHVLISERIVDKVFNNVPVIGKDASYAYRITPPTITIKVKGPSNLIEKLYEDKGIQAYIDLKGLKPGRYKKRATITLPVKITLIDANPETFKINIANRKAIR
ncbi:MAG: CdaR family protein [Desulfobacterales bacterium]